MSKNTDFQGSLPQSSIFVVVIIHKNENTVNVITILSFLKIYLFNMKIIIGAKISSEIIYLYMENLSSQTIYDVAKNISKKMELLSNRFGEAVIFALVLSREIKLEFEHLL